MQLHQLKALLWGLVALFLPALASLAVVDAGLKVPASPAGIISFEFCGFTASCDATLSQWGIKGQQLAMLSLGLDYLFLIIYPSIICVGLLLLVPLVPAKLKTITTWLAWFALGAGAADAAENFFLIRVVLSGSGASYGAAASICAAIKFAILGLSLMWLLFTSAAYGLQRNNA